MKVTKVEPTKVSVKLSEPARFATRIVKQRDYTVVKVEVDDGLVGTGIAWFHHTGEIIREHLADLVVGQDPFNIERIWNAMYLEVYRERKRAAICAVSAVDIALWDIIGKALKLPLFRLLGGFREKVPCYASGGYYREGKELEGLRREMQGYIEQGFKAVKIKVGAATLDEDLLRLKAVREVVGDEVAVAVDANNGYNRNEALKAGRAFEKYNIRWFEEPVWPDDLEGNAMLARALDTPVAVGELEYTRHGFRELIDRRAVDIIQPDAISCGGITEFMKIAKMAEVFAIPVAPYDTYNINVHLVAAIPNGLTVEYFAKEADIMKDAELYQETLTPKGWFAISSEQAGPWYRVK